MDHDRLTARGEEVEVRRSARRRRTISAHRENGRVVVLVPHDLSADEERAWVDTMVAKVVAREARSRAPAGDDDLARRAQGLLERCLWPAVGERRRPVSVSWVSNQSRRWGSCSTGAGTIRLSDRLRPMPDWVVDYVLVHELAHLYERDHSPRFWELVATYPQTERARGYLTGWSEAYARIRPEDAPAPPTPEP